MTVETTVPLHALLSFILALKNKITLWLDLLGLIILLNYGKLLYVLITCIITWTLQPVFKPLLVSNYEKNLLQIGIIKLQENNALLSEVCYY